MEKTVKEIILWGATGQAIVLEEFLQQAGFQIVAVFDNNTKVKSPFNHVPIYYQKAGFNDWLTKQGNKMFGFIVAIGGENGSVRISISEHLQSLGLIAISAIHPTAYIARNAVLGQGVQIMANATVCARSVIGNYCIINTSAIVDHECNIGTGVHIAPGAKLAGCITVDDLAFIGTAAVILPRMKIGRNTVVGAGAVVTKNLPDNVIANGNPARVIRTNKK